MKIRLLREYVRALIEELESSNDLQLPKGKWVMVKPGDPRRETIKQNIFDLVSKTYAPIGGHFKIKSPEDLESSTYWAVQDLDDDPDVDVVMLAKSESGAKMATAANDGSSAAASSYKEKSVDLFKGGDIDGIGNWWGETSDKVAYALLSRGAPAIEDEMTVRRIMPGDRIVWHGEHPDPNAPEVFKRAKGWYTKFFGTHPSTKIVLGNPV